MEKSLLTSLLQPTVGALSREGLFPSLEKRGWGRFSERNSIAGFTLIEVVISLVVVSVLITMVYTFFGSSFTGSTAPITRMGESLQLQTVIENITADYMPNDVRHTYLPLSDLKTAIGAEGSVQNNNTYGSINGVQYSYTVVYNHYIKFVSNVEADDTGGAQNLLKVTLKYSSGESLTVLYSLQ